MTVHAATPQAAAAAPTKHPAQNETGRLARSAIGFNLSGVSGCYRPPTTVNISRLVWPQTKELPSPTGGGASQSLAEAEVARLQQLEQENWSRMRSYLTDQLAQIEPNADPSLATR